MINLGRKSKILVLVLTTIIFLYVAAINLDVDFKNVIPESPPKYKHCKDEIAERLSSKFLENISAENDISTANGEIYINNVKNMKENNTLLYGYEIMVRSFNNTHYSKDNRNESPEVEIIRGYVNYESYYPYVEYKDDYIFRVQEAEGVYYSAYVEVTSNCFIEIRGKVARSDNPDLGIYMSIIDEVR